MQKPGILTAEPRRARGRPRAEDAAELESRLVRVARQCFLTHGYGATSMSQIAKLARVSKSTLYARFPDKADLFLAIINEQVQSMGGTALLPVAKPAALEDMLCAYAEHSLFESLYTDVLQLNRLIYSEMVRFSELGAAVRTRTKTGVRQVAELIRNNAQSEGIACSNPEACAETFTTLLRGLYSDLMYSGTIPEKSEVSATVRQMVRIFIAGRPGW